MNFLSIRGPDHDAMPEDLVGLTMATSPTLGELAAQSARIGYADTVRTEGAVGCRCQ